MKILLIFCLFFTALFAENHEHHFDRDLKYLKLTMTQKKQIKSILKSHIRNIKKYRNLKEKVKKEKEKIFSQDELNKKDIIELNNQLNIKSTNIEIQFLEQIHNILGKRQKIQFSKYLNDWEIE